MQRICLKSGKYMDAYHEHNSNNACPHNSGSNHPRRLWRYDIKLERNIKMFLLIKRTKVQKLILILFVVGFLTYFSSFTNQFVWDDYHFFNQNILIQDLSHINQIFFSNTTAGAGVSSNYYRPFTSLTYALDHTLFGWNVIEMHISNTLFHCINAALLFLLLFMLRFGKVKSFLVSLIFLIHPIQTEAVTYLSSRGDVLYTFFLLLSLLFFTITCYRNGITIDIAQKRINISQTVLLFLSVLLFPLSILSKEGALTTVPMYAAILIIIALQKKITRKKIHETYNQQILTILILILQTIIYFFLRLTVLDFSNSLNYSGGNDLYSTHLWIRLLTFISTIPQYLQLLIVPYPLYLERDIPVTTSVLNPMVWFGMILIVICIILCLIELRKKHTAWIFFGLVIIFANLLSVSGIIPQTALIRENWLYMPVIGFYMIIFRLIEHYCLPLLKKYQKTITAIFIIYCLILIAMTIQQNYNWRSNIAYYEHNLRFTNTARLQLNLGHEYLAKGDYKKALIHLQESVRLDGDY